MRLVDRAVRWLAKRLPALSGVDGGGWITLNPPGAFQLDIEIRREEVLAFSAVFACITLIAADLGKLRLKLVELTDDGIWQEFRSPAFSPVLHKPNRFQSRQKFIEQWTSSKLYRGNAYILKERDQRQVVVALYVLHPDRTTPLVSEDGDVYYRLGEDRLAQVAAGDVVVPASEIIHDRMHCLFHPLVGVSPLYACGLAATQGLRITNSSAKFFDNMARPSGVLTAPARISDETAARIKEHWEKNYRSGNVGKIAVLGDGLKYEPMSVTAVDADLVKQLQLSAEQVCSAFHVPGYMVGVGPAPTYNNIEALGTMYYSQCLQSLIKAAQSSLTEGLGLDAIVGRTLSVHFDLDELLLMDTATRVKALADQIGAGVMAPNEARQKVNLPPVEGGESPYLQQQNYALAALAKRDAKEDPFATAPTAAPTPTAANDDSIDEEAAKAIVQEALRPINDGIIAADAALRELREAQVAERAMLTAIDGRLAQQAEDAANAEQFAALLIERIKALEPHAAA